MVSRLFGLLLVFVFISSARASGPTDLHFVEDSVTVAYSYCNGDSGFVRAHLVNAGISQVIIEGFRPLDSSGAFQLVRHELGDFHLAGQIIAPGDTIWLEFKALASGRRKQFIVDYAGKSDTILVIAEFLAPAISPSNITRDFGTVLIGDSASFAFDITNTGSAPYIPQSLFPNAEQWVVRGLEPGDTLHPGQTIAARLVFLPAQQLGTYRQFIYQIAPCTNLSFQLEIIVRPNGPGWVESMMRDTIRGCRRGSSFTAHIVNAAKEAKRIDSVTFAAGYTNGWSFITPPPQGRMMEPGEQIEIAFERNSQGDNTAVLVHSGGLSDSLRIVIAESVAVPKFTSVQDTIVISRKPGDQVNYSFELENAGREKYKITSMQITGSPYWTITLPDTSKSIGFRQMYSFRADLYNGSKAGEFPLSVTVSGEPCDTVLTHTVIAKIAVADVTDKERQARRSIMPSIASNSLTLVAEDHAAYRIVDLLGREYLRGIHTASNSIDITSLPQGAYLIEVEFGGERSTQRFTVKR